MFHTHVGTDIVHPHLIQNQAQNQRNSPGCILYSTSPSPVPTAVLLWSYSEYQAFLLAVGVGVSAAGLLFVPVNWEDQLLPFVPCKKGSWVPNHTFLPFDWDFIVHLCLLPLGKVLLLPLFLLPWPNNLLEVTSSFLQPIYVTSCLHQAMEYLFLPLQVLMLMLMLDHC